MRFSLPKMPKKCNQEIRSFKQLYSTYKNQNVHQQTTDGRSSFYLLVHSRFLAYSALLYSFFVISTFKYTVNIYTRHMYFIRV